MPDPITRLNAALEGRYRIERELGAGGMATVYLAEDEKHKRKVALKVLKPELAAVVGAERFLAEIKTTANLQHPHILPLFDSGEAASYVFYVMPFVEGESLRERLDREHQLPVDEAVKITTDLAEALGYAHRHGVIHRDIKPANILLSSGRPLVADFGIALAVSSAGGDRLTETGLSMGTPYYMSPEQAAGDGHIDARSDIYSLAAMMYEMLAGEPPYTGRTALAIIGKKMVDPIPSVRRVRSSVPEAVDTAIMQALEKLPADRFRSVEQFVDALTADAPLRPSAVSKKNSGEVLSSSAREVPWIAVLPFRTRSADPALEDFGDDLAEIIVTGLSRFTQYFVVAASSTFRFKGRVEDVREVARELGARYVLEGSVREAANNVRVNVQLSDAVLGTGLWAETFDRDLTSQDIFSLQDDLADRIVAIVADGHGVLARSMGALVKSKPVETLSAYESVLQWFAYFEVVTPAEHLRTREALERAVEGDPNYGSAWACLSEIYLDEHRFDFNPREDPLGRALDAARKAVELDATSALAARSLALAYFFGRDLVAFRSATERAITLNPTDASTLAMLGIQKTKCGDWDAGMSMVRRAMSLNPYYPGWYYFAHFDDHYRKHEYEQALATAKKINMPAHFFYHAAIAACAGQLGLADEGRVALNDVLRIVPDFAHEPRANYALWNFPEEAIDHMLEGFRKAGLKISS